MKRYALLPALLFLTGFALVSCSQAISVSSKYWKYSDEDGTYEILLKPDGHIYSYNPNDATPENDFWKQRGKRVTFTMNDHYATYKGKLINDSTLAGKASSIGFRWRWTAKFVTTY